MVVESDCNQVAGRGGRGAFDRLFFFVTQIVSLEKTGFLILLFLL